MLAHGQSPVQPQTQLSELDVIRLTLTVSPMRLNRPSTGSEFASLQWSYRLLISPVL